MYPPSFWQSPVSPHYPATRSGSLLLASHTFWESNTTQRQFVRVLPLPSTILWESATAQLRLVGVYCNSSSQRGSLPLPTYTLWKSSNTLLHRAEEWEPTTPSFNCIGVYHSRLYWMRVYLVGDFPCPASDCGNLLLPSFMKWELTTTTQLHIVGTTCIRLCTADIVMSS
jgi:hypothetical protein